MAKIRTNNGMLAAALLAALLMMVSDLRTLVLQ